MQYAGILLTKAPLLYIIHMALLLNFMSRQFQNIFNHFHLVLLIILFRAVAYNAQGFHNDHLANDDLLNAHTTRTMPHNTCAVRTYHSTPRTCIVLLMLQHYIQCPWIWKMHCVPLHWIHRRCDLYKKKFPSMLSSDLEGANTLFASFQAARTKTGPISDFCIHDSRTDWPKWQECHSSTLLNTCFQEGGQNYFDETNHWPKWQECHWQFLPSNTVSFFQVDSDINLNKENFDTFIAK